MPQQRLSRRLAIGFLAGRFVRRVPVAPPISHLPVPLQQLGSQGDVESLVQSLNSNPQTAVRSVAVCPRATDDGEPGDRIPNVFYGAYVRDLDGNKLCFMEMKAG